MCTCIDTLFFILPIWAGQNVLLPPFLLKNWNDATGVVRNIKSRVTVDNTVMSLLYDLCT